MQAIETGDLDADAKAVVAVAVSALPTVPLDEVVTLACHVYPDLRRYDRELIVDAATRLAR